MTITVVNPDVTQPRQAEISLLGGDAVSGRATVLTNADIHAHNTFDQKRVVAPQTKSLEISGRTLNYVFPPASVTKLALTLS